MTVSVLCQCHRNEKISSVLMPVHFPAVGTVDCNFESNLCGWAQATDDRFNWTRFNSSTGTISTGPQTDHTTGRKWASLFVFSCEDYSTYVIVGGSEATCQRRVSSHHNAGGFC